MKYIQKCRKNTLKSFVRAGLEHFDRDEIVFDDDKWIYSDYGWKSFYYDTSGATKSDIVIYIGPSGTDAWAEVGAAFASKIRVLGLQAKGEPAGLMRHMVYWYNDYKQLLEAIERLMLDSL